MFHVKHPMICIKGIVTKKIRVTCSTWNTRLLGPGIRSVGGSQPFQITSRRVIALGSLRVHDASNAV